MLELCFDASAVSIRNHDMFAAYAPTVSEGVGTSCEGVATYLPPVRVPELAWRKRDPDEPITEQDREWWERHGWLSQRGVRAYQAVRSVQHVLVNMLETKTEDFVSPKGLSRKSVGDRRIWDKEDGRWYRGTPPVPGTCHRTSMVPELPNTGQVPRFLLLTMDQKQCWFRGDLYHRSWNDFRWALRNETSQSSRHQRTNPHAKNAEEVPGFMANLSTVALDGMDPDNSKNNMQSSN